MRVALDRYYSLTLWLAAVCVLAIAVLVGLQVGGRIVDAALRLGGRPAYGFMVASLAEIAGYLLAAATFLALAGTLKRGAHIRVTLLLGTLPEGVRRLFELWALAAGAALAAFMTVSIVALTYDSIRFNEISYGLIPVPLAIPQAAMAVGLASLLLSLLDELALTLRSGRPSFRAGEDSLAGDREP